MSPDDTANFVLYDTIQGHKQAISSVKFSPYGEVLASSSNDRSVRLWNSDTGKHITSLLGHELGISDVAWSPDGYRIATASDDTNVNIWDPRVGLIKTLKGHTNYVMCVNFHPNGNLLATGSFDNTARIWNIDSGVCLHRLSAHDEMVVSSHFDPKGTQLVTAGFDGFVRVWDVESGSLLHNFVVSEKKPVCFARWSPNGKYILVGSFDGTWKLLNAKTGQPARTYTGHHFNDYCIFASFLLSGGKWIVSGSADKTVCIWDINSKQLIQKLSGHTDVVVAVEAHPTNQIIVSGALDHDKSIRLWKQTTDF